MREMRSNCKTTCCQKVGIKKGPWTHKEDEILTSYIKKEGEGRWRTLPENAGLLRCGKSCRLRWMNYLRPSVKRGQITMEEEQLIIQLHRLLGNRWSLIAKRIPGRTDNEIKNYWNTHLSKKLISQGVDPRTHMPLEPSPDPSQIYCLDSTMTINDSSYHSPGLLGLNQGISGYDATTRPEQYQVHGFNEYIINKDQLGIASDQSSMVMQDGHDNNYGKKEVLARTQRSNANSYSNEEVSAGRYGSYEKHYGNEEVSMGMQGSNETYQENEGEGLFDYCNNDKAFSLFLNSLMNEDNFGNQQEPTAIDGSSSSMFFCLWNCGVFLKQLILQCKTLD